MGKLVIQVALVALVVTCLLATSLAKPNKGKGPGKSKGKGKQGRFHPATCRVVNGTDIWEQDCGSKNLECVPLKHRGPRPGGRPRPPPGGALQGRPPPRPGARPPPPPPEERHAFMKNLKINVCKRKNCTTSDDCDGVECSARGKCKIPRAERERLAACQIDDTPARPCPPKMHCATMCGKNVTIDDTKYLLAECHLDKDVAPPPPPPPPPGQLQDSDFQDLDGDGDDDDDKDGDGNDDDDGDGDDDDDEEEEDADGDGDDGDK